MEVGRAGFGVGVGGAAVGVSVGGMGVSVGGTGVGVGGCVGVGVGVAVGMGVAVGGIGVGVGVHVARAASAGEGVAAGEAPHPPMKIAINSRVKSAIVRFIRFCIVWVLQIQEISVYPTVSALEIAVSDVCFRSSQRTP